MMMPNHKGVMLFERACDDDIVALNAPCRCLHIYPLTASRKIGREATEEIVREERRDRVGDRSLGEREVVLHE